MPYPPQEYNICPCCGTEFENDDEDCSHAQLRANWIARGAKWFFRQQPPTWNPWQQLANANVPLPYETTVTYLNSVVSAPHFQTLFYGAPLVTSVSVFYKAASTASAGAGDEFSVGEQYSTVLVGELAEDVMGMAA